jgi:glyoxylase-like metal-dependent hydrolase (beta-lactamase superfamily II)
MTLQGTNTYVVGIEGGAWVIDPGPDDEDHLAAVRASAEGRGGLAGVLLTHSHGDHSAGAPRLGQVAAPDLGPFEVVPTPGHSEDHVCFLHGRVCFAGDLVLGEGSSIVPPAANGGSLADYIESLRRLRGLKLELICPGHGSWITDPGAKLDEYLEHRLQRERKLVAALEAGERSRTRLLDAAWDDVPSPLRPAAALAMQAHLEKLEAEGRLPEGLED